MKFIDLKLFIYNKQLVDSIHVAFQRYFKADRFTKCVCEREREWRGGGGGQRDKQTDRQKDSERDKERQRERKRQRERQRELGKFKIRENSWNNFCNEHYDINKLKKKLEFGFSSSTKSCFIRLDECLFKMMKNAFYFIITAFSFSRYLSFCLDLLVM